MRKSLGLSGATGSFADFDHADAAILIGANPTEGHPVVGARIKQAALRGLKLVVIDPRRIELCRVRRAAPAAAPGHERRRHARARARRAPRRPHGPRLPARPHRGLARGRGDDRGVHAAGGRADLRHPGRGPRARGAHLRRGRERLHLVGPGRHRASLRLRGRAPHLQPRPHDRQHRSPGRRAAAAARAEQRPGLVRHGRAARHVHDVPLGRRRRGRALLRGGVGRPAVAREGLHDPADVRCGGRRRPQGDVHLRRGRRADRSGHAPRRQGARVARVPRLPGHLRDRDDEVRRRGPARVRLPGEGRARSSTPSVGCRSSSPAIDPARRREDGLRDPHHGLGGARPPDGLRDAVGRPSTRSRR